MRIICLGTGTSQGIPVIGCTCKVCNSTDKKDKRLRSSVHIQVAGLNLQIDIGPDFRYQMLSNGLSKVDHLLLTHEHNDHVAGLDDIRPINFNYKKSIPIYAEERVLDQLKIRFHYAFSETRYPGAPTLELIPITTDSFVLDDVQIIPIRVIHGNLPILGYRVGDAAYLTDVKSIPDEELDKLKGLEVLIISALRAKPHFSHLTLEEAISLSKRIGARKTYLTHISHLMGTHEQAEADLPDNISLAHDGLLIDI